jgi:hypothetical protein
MKFRDFLIEGVIKTPPKVKKQIIDFVMKEGLSSIRDRVLKVGSNYDESFLKAYKKMSSKYGVKSQNNENIEIVALKYDLRGMPSNYPRDKVVDVTAVAVLQKIENLDKKFGQFDSARNILVVNVFRMGVNTIINSEKLRSFEKQVMEVVEHELMHSVQTKLLGLKFNTSLIKELFPKANSTERYLLLPEEFDPQIVSSLDEFRKLTRAHSDISHRKLLDGFVMADKEAHHTLTSQFFWALKKHDEQRWRIAVKKFTILLKSRYSYNI